MQAIIGDYLTQTTLGALQTHHALGMFPLLAERDFAPEHMTLDDAIEAELLSVREVDGSGSVPRLLLKSEAERYVVLLDGEELVGAKQNRIVNTSILVAPGAELHIPVSCVEEGRWAARSSTFGTQRRMGYASLRAQKADQVLSNVRGAGTFDADQDAVWLELTARRLSRDVSSQTGAMADIYEHGAAALNDYVDALRPQRDQVGALFTLGGQVVGLECFGRREVASQVLPKLVQSYAMDAIALQSADHTARRPHKGSANRFMQAAARAALEPHEGVGDGVDFRIVSKTLTGLVLARESDVFHLSALRRQSADGGTRGSGGGMIRFSRRCRLGSRG